MIEKIIVVAPTTAVPISTGLAVALKVFAGPVVRLEQVLGRLEIHVDAVVALERLLHVRNLLDEGQLKDRLALSVTGP